MDKNFAKKMHYKAEHVLIFPWQLDRTLKYVPGRKYDRAGTTEGSRKSRRLHLREERVNGVPSSFKKLDFFLREKKMDMADFVRETCEKDFEKVVEEMDVDGEVEDELEIVPETGVGRSDDEEEFSDGDNDNYDSD